VRHDLRRKLTIDFVFLFVALYFLGGAVAIFLFATQLDVSLDEELQELAYEALPAVEYIEGKPSLRDWAHRASARHDKLLSTVQVFDRSQKLTEEFGPSGYPKLCLGNAIVKLTDNNKTQTFGLRSRYVEIMDGPNSIGYLQVQVSVKQRDDALRQIILTMLALTPFLALAVAVCGSWFAGNAVRPVEETMSLLRQFVMDAAHEINTPITVIEASVQTLEDDINGEGAHSDVLRIIERATGRMKALGQSLVVLAKMESPEYRLPIEKFALKELFYPLFAECKQLSLAKGVALIAAPVPEVLINGNREALDRVFLNLISNAINYTDKGGSVTVSFSIVSGDNGGKVVCIMIDDTGVGIPAESLSKIFERFYRVDSSRARHMGGFGLGLSIVKSTVERHQGEIEVESNVGSGSRFTVKLACVG